MIKEVCNKLKEKRKELGYSIEYVVDKTKLHPSMIRDIENGKLSNINSTYIKGFMKIYASFLGVDLGDSLKELSSSKPAIKKEIKSKKSKEESSVFDKMIVAASKVSLQTKKRIVLGVAAIILVWVFINASVAVIKKISSAFKKPAKQTSTIQKNPIAPVVPETESIEGIEVAVTLKRKCFLKVIVDGSLLFEGVLNKGAVETWKADEEIRIERISDGSAVSLEVNGEPTPTLASIRKPIKRIKITPSGITVDK